MRTIRVCALTGNFQITEITEGKARWDSGGMLSTRMLTQIDTNSLRRQQ